MGYSWVEVGGDGDAERTLPLVFEMGIGIDGEVMTSAKAQVRCSTVESVAYDQKAYGPLAVVVERAEWLLDGYCWNEG